MPLSDRLANCVRHNFDDYIFKHAHEPELAIFITPLPNYVLNCLLIKDYVVVSGSLMENRKSCGVRIVLVQISKDLEQVLAIVLDLL